MYKFEIHKNLSKASTSGDFVDLTRYAEGSYSLDRTISPIWNELSFKWARENDRMFFRKKLDGEFTLIGEDYDWIKGIREDANERNKYRILIIKEQIDGVWTEVWRGFFSVIIGKWDLSKCTATFSDLLVWDEYTEYLENIERERNLLDVYPYPVVYNVPSYDWEEHFVPMLYPFNVSAPCVTGIPDISPDEYFYDGGATGDDKYTLYKRDFYILKNFLTGTAYWGLARTYRRDVLEQVNNPGADWVSLGAVTAGSDEQKWVRTYLGITSPSFIKSERTIGYDRGDGTFGSCDVDVYTLNEAVYGEFDEYTNERARVFTAVVNYSIYGWAYPTPFYSNFFLDETNPITGEANQLNSLFLIQFSDLEDTSDPARRAMYTFKDVEEWMSLMKVYWYIEDDNFRFEHKKFFDNGLTYGSPSVGIDITANSEAREQARKTSVFSYGSKSLPRIQEIKMSYESGDDFYGTPITYNGSMANWDSESKMTVSSSNLSTDLAGAVLNSDAGNDGFMLVATELTDSLWYNVITDTGALTGMPRVNAPLSIANIQDKFWRWAAQSAIGTINKQFVQFDDLENNFVQEEFEITWCDDFDPYKLVRTDYGDGRIEEAMLTLKDRKLTLTLSYSE